MKFPSFRGKKFKCDVCERKFKTEEELDNMFERSIDVRTGQL